MVDTLVFDIIFALAIGIVISLIASVRHARTKALIYSLPVPMTLALIATGGHVNVSHIIGLLLVTLFLWLVTLLKRLGLNIYAADLLATLAYIGVGYLAVTYLTIPFFAAVAGCAFLWILFVALYRGKQTPAQRKSDRIPPVVKFPIVSALAFVLLNLKTWLAGAIVTFPFSGVFAVIETRHMLRTLSATFTRNAIAMLGFFVTIFCLNEWELVAKLAVAWVVYLILLRMVTLLVPLKS